PTPSASATTGGSGGSCAAAWSNSTAYVSGNEVSYQGENWTANQWNYNEVPGGPSGAWNSDGSCG
ncbi:chitinase, partial [Actinospica durhamensis]|nr:chitinase [Actinospica durhamensis]